MASITGLHTPTTNAVEIPELWPGLVLEFQKANLVMANLVERRDMDVANGGDIIHFPVTAAESVVAYTNGKRLTDNLSANTDTEVTLTIDKFYFSGFHIPYHLAAQSKYDIKAERLRAAGYAIAKQIDTDVAALADSLTTTDINAPGATAQTDDLVVDDIVDAYTTLNNNDVPATDRQWVFHPSAYGELLKMTGNYFVSYDFRNGKPLENGLIGQILGSPVYQSTNVDTASAGSPAETAYNNLYFHKQAFALAMQVRPDIDMGYDIDTMGELVNVKTAYGVAMLRGDFGVCIKTVAD
jgi:HK97 family phage major capsid protein